MNHPKIVQDIMYTMALLLGLCLFFYAFPANAEVSAAQVKRIANRVITARASELQGPPGPEGPQGLQGPQGDPGSSAVLISQPPFLYAHVLANGEVDESRSSGVTSADVKVLDVIGFDPALNSYCFTIPANGAQVTLDADETIIGSTAQVFFARRDGCEFFVTVVNRELVRAAAGFFITIY